MTSQSELAVIGPKSKRCTRCLVVKENIRDNFHINVTKSEGVVLRPDCADCCRKLNRQRYAKRTVDRDLQANTVERSRKLRAARNAALTKLTKKYNTTYQIIYAEELKKRELTLSRYDGLQISNEEED